MEKAEILREKGTDRSKFFRGQVDKYRWMDYGSSYLPSELNAAYLYAQLEARNQIFAKRMEIYNYYHKNLAHLAQEGKIEQPYVPEECSHNAHMYYIKVRDIQVRTRLIAYLREKESAAYFITCLFILHLRDRNLEDFQGKMFILQRKVNVC